MVETTQNFSKADPEAVFSDLQKKAANAKDVSLHAAGSKGMDKFKLAVLDGVHTVLDKTRKATKWSANEGAGISAVVGGGIFGLGLMSGLSAHEMMLSSTSLVPVWGARAVMAFGALSAAAATTNALSSTALKTVISAKRKLYSKINGQNISPVISQAKGRN